jgi:hypothetical protein
MSHGWVDDKSCQVRTELKLRNPIVPKERSSPGIGPGFCFALILLRGWLLPLSAQ